MANKPPSSSREEATQVTRVEVPPLELRQPTVQDDRSLEHLLRVVAAAFAPRHEAEGFVRPLIREEGAPEALMSL